MLVGIDLSPLTYNLTGIGVYVQYLLENVSQLDDTIRWRFPVHCELPVRALLRWSMASKISRSTHERIEIDAKFAVLHSRRQNGRSCRLPAEGMRLFHITNAQSQFNEFELPMVITVHDLAWMRVDRDVLPAPRIYGLDRLPALILKAQHVICDSECTRQDVIQLTGRNSLDVSTVHLAQRAWCQPPPEGFSFHRVRLQHSKGRRYFLAISTIEPRKNYVRLIKAFSQFKKKHSDFDLVIVGAKAGAWPEVSEEIRSARMANSVHVLGRVSDARLRELLWGCEALLYPSLYEGFGLPVLEAMACGTPVICSTAGSLAEVVSDAALVVDPFEVDSITDGLQKFVVCSAVQDELRRKSLVNAQRFSWVRTAERTLEIYRRVASC